MASLRLNKDHRANGIAAGLLVLALILIVGAVLWQFMAAFFIAVVGYVYLNPVYKALRGKGLGKTLSGWITMIIGAILIAIPSIFILNAVINETAGLINPTTMSNNYNALTAGFSNLGNYLPAGVDPNQVSMELGKIFFQATIYLQSLLVGWLESAGGMALGFLIMVFTFYYLLVAEGSLGKVRAVIPFSKKNTDTLISEFRKVLYSSIVVTGLMAVIQAVPLTLVFMYFNVPGAVFLGFIAAILTCIPFTGIPFVWIPIAALELLGGNYPAGIGIIIAGLIIAVIENFRPVFQNKIGEIHPLVSLLGAIIGVIYFGILGLFIGPILLSFTLLSARMFKEEYL
ncbi:MAG: AI-2E family transporter [Candidatus Micrarchaeota archaeon]|nr:AI-2E family transporter [Candidatus Micrarchaeota archaeon]